MKGALGTLFDSDDSLTSLACFAEDSARSGYLLGQLAELLQILGRFDLTKTWHSGSYSILYYCLSQTS